MVLDLPLYIIERINELQQKDKETRTPSYRIPKGALVTKWLEASPLFNDGTWKRPAAAHPQNGHPKPGKTGK
jgi:hypothetical protein